MIKKILIDLDQTILNHDRGIKHALDFLYLTCKNNYKYQCVMQRYHHCNHELWSMYEKGIIDVSTLIEIRNRFILREFDISRYELYRFNNIYTSECSIFPVWLKIFPYLKKNIEIYVFSNGLKKIQLKKIKSARITNVFSGFFFGERAPLNKPNMEFLEEIYSCFYNIKKSEILVIGDSLVNDISPAKRYGFNTLIFSNNEDEYTFIKKLIWLINYGNT
ncbi:HAD family hydrolase [Haemophilus influenzae]|uniref:HAD-hydrolase YfnB n=1 Tax=Haemophilus influenzae TaxID=727 RepID=A0AAQ1PW72_HAEIF|nr:HAD-IA family hydrolase [Haemophilus influenzae]RFN96331.1 hypothetical protein CH638_03725 [Haemophilus influenzae]SQG35485.1 nucleotidase [Haemophilus influenzae]VTX58842.1 Putative HAD-hydrolase YfnB [Haemophilus influenzae]